MEETRCRLCLEGEEDGPLVQPCACSGSVKWIHEHCLEKWRRTGPKQDAAYRCGLCTDRYRDSLSLELLRARLQGKRTRGEATRFTLGALASELHAQGKHDEAEPLYREALEKAKGNRAASEPLYRELLEAQRETLGDRHPSTLLSISSLGTLLDDKGDLAAAEPLYREVLEAQRETLGDRHPSTLDTIDQLGALLEEKGDFAAAEPLYREALEVKRENLGNRHKSTLLSVIDHGVLLYAKGDLAAAEPLFREAIETYRETLGTRRPGTLTSISNLGALLWVKGLRSPRPAVAGQGRPCRR